MKIVYFFSARSGELGRCGRKYAPKVAPLSNYVRHISHARSGVWNRPSIVESTGAIEILVDINLAEKLRSYCFNNKPSKP